jgi:hypothetical protein
LTDSEAFSLESRGPPSSHTETKHQEATIKEGDFALTPRDKLRELLADDDNCPSFLLMRKSNRYGPFTYETEADIDSIVEMAVNDAVFVVNK